MAAASSSAATLPSSTVNDYGWFVEIQAPGQPYAYILTKETGTVTFRDKVLSREQILALVRNKFFPPESVQHFVEALPGQGFEVYLPAPTAGVAIPPATGPAPVAVAPPVTVSVPPAVSIAPAPVVPAIAAPAPAPVAAVLAPAAAVAVPSVAKAAPEPVNASAAVVAVVAVDAGEEPDQPAPGHPQSHQEAVMPQEAPVHDDTPLSNDELSSLREMVHEVRMDNKRKKTKQVVNWAAIGAVLGRSAEFTEREYERAVKEEEEAKAKAKKAEEEKKESAMREEERAKAQAKREADERKAAKAKAMKDAWEEAQRKRQEEELERIRAAREAEAVKQKAAAALDASGGKKKAAGGKQQGPAAAAKQAYSATAFTASVVGSIMAAMAPPRPAVSVSMPVVGDDAASVSSTRVDPGGSRGSLAAPRKSSDASLSSTRPRPSVRFEDQVAASIGQTASTVSAGAGTSVSTNSMGAAGSSDASKSAVEPLSKRQKTSHEADQLVQDAWHGELSISIAEGLLGMRRASVDTSDAGRSSAAQHAASLAGTAATAMTAAGGEGNAPGGASPSDGADALAGLKEIPTASMLGFAPPPASAATSSSSSSSAATHALAQSSFAQGASAPAAAQSGASAGSPLSITAKLLSFNHYVAIFISTRDGKELRRKAREEAAAKGLPEPPRSQLPSNTPLIDEAETPQVFQRLSEAERKGLISSYAGYQENMMQASAYSMPYQPYVDLKGLLRKQVLHPYQFAMAKATEAKLASLVAQYPPPADILRGKLLVIAAARQQEKQRRQAAASSSSSSLVAAGEATDERT